MWNVARSNKRSFWNEQLRQNASKSNVMWSVRGCALTMLSNGNSLKMSLFGVNLFAQMTWNWDSSFVRSRLSSFGLFFPTGGLYLERSVNANNIPQKKKGLKRKKKLFLHVLFLDSNAVRTVIHYIGWLKPHASHTRTYCLIVIVIFPWELLGTRTSISISLISSGRHTISNKSII